MFRYVCDNTRTSTKCVFDAGKNKNIPTDLRPRSLRRHSYKHLRTNTRTYKKKIGKIRARNKVVPVVWMLPTSTSAREHQGEQSDDVIHCQLIRADIDRKNTETDRDRWTRKEKKRRSKKEEREPQIFQFKVYEIFWITSLAHMNLQDSTL